MKSCENCVHWHIKNQRESTWLGTCDIPIKLPSSVIYTKVVMISTNGQDCDFHEPEPRSAMSRLLKKHA